MAVATLRQLRLRLVMVVGLLAALLVSLHLMTGAVQNSNELARIFVPLLLFSLAGLAVLLGVVLTSLVQLIGAYRRGEPGTRLTVRMVVLFVLISVVPAGVVYGYSLQFLMRGIESWFDVEIDDAMQDALELGRASLDLHKRNLQHATENLLADLQGEPRATLGIALSELRRQSGATEIAVMDPTGSTRASSNVDPGVLVAYPPDSFVLQQVREGLNYVGVTPYGEDGRLHVRAVVAERGDAPFLVQALYPLTQRVSELSEDVQAAFTRYRELAFLRQSLKFSFSLTLSLVLLFSVLSAVGAALFAARRLVAPVSELAMATRAVAEGDYNTQLPPPRRRDELGFLVRSFNGMTRRIAQARDAAAESQRLVESQRAYLQSVLSHLSTGVMTFDYDGKLRTANAATGQILGIDPGRYVGTSIRQLAEGHQALAPLVEAVMTEWGHPPREWEHQVALVDGEKRKVLRCGGSPLPLGDDSRGWLVVIEDITMLIQAQRDSAWGEVARRLAHEIKNPLTPIQLSAERIRRRYLGRLGTEEGEVLDRATHTIVQQVEAMKSMVNAFSDYARPSKLSPEPLLFDRVVAEVLELYRAAAGFALEIQLASNEARIRADSVKLRQVIHNLVKNAAEALSDRENGVLRVSTRYLTQEDARVVELIVEDNGPGFDSEVMGRAFDPYVTTKAKGTGLGLAIVRKIVEEHGGSIAAGQSGLGGGKVVVRLPECDAPDPA